MYNNSCLKVNSCWPRGPPEIWFELGTSAVWLATWNDHYHCFTLFFGPYPSLLNSHLDWPLPFPSNLFCSYKEIGTMFYIVSELLHLPLMTSTTTRSFENLQKIHAEYLRLEYPRRNRSTHPFRSSFIAEQKEIPRKVGQLLSSRVDLLPHELPGDGDHDRKRHQMCYGQVMSTWNLPLNRDSTENSWGYVVNMMVQPAIRNWMHPVLRGWSWIHWVCGYPLF